MVILTICALGLTVGGFYFVICFMLSPVSEEGAAVPPVMPAAVLAAAGLATLGWLTAAYNQRVLSRKQHTLNLLMQWRNSALYQQHLDAILKLSARGAALTTDQLDFFTSDDLSFNEEKFRKASVYVLNYWEFICASVIVKDLDAELVRRTVRPHIVGCHHKFEPWISRCQKTNPREFEHLCTLAKEWA